MAKKSDSAAGKLITVSVLGLSGEIILLDYDILNMISYECKNILLQILTWCQCD